VKGLCDKKEKVVEEVVEKTEPVVVIEEVSEPVEVILEEVKKEPVELSFNAYFLLNTDTVSNPTELEEFISKIKVDNKIYLTGYDCDCNSQKESYEIAKKRAEVISRLLINKGFNETSIIIMSRGKLNPIATNDTDEGKRQNRRVEILVR
jgi:OOP family OmpA-OmpF porin